MMVEPLKQRSPSHLLTQQEKNMVQVSSLLPNRIIDSVKSNLVQQHKSAN